MLSVYLSEIRAQLQGWLGNIISQQDEREDAVRGGADGAEPMYEVQEEGQVGGWAASSAA
jgi:hypothetical protein